MSKISRSDAAVAALRLSVPASLEVPDIAGCPRHASEASTLALVQPNAKRVGEEDQTSESGTVLSYWSRSEVLAGFGEFMLPSGSQNL